ncbi:hypothetical protein CEXT_153481 [Caerostris extrusa]|uniref:Uncharacterized protein n=1 Tax=Caerostris extrusa TaxID=172846 RepID=A0AAV4WVR7_CAEEX|nr:hypothetical protein CEXT_153481 [Caerostris extrusa]
MQNDKFCDISRVMSSYHKTSTPEFEIKRHFVVQKNKALVWLSLIIIAPLSTQRSQSPTEWLTVDELLDCMAYLVVPGGGRSADKLIKVSQILSQINLGRRILIPLRDCVYNSVYVVSTIIFFCSVVAQKKLPDSFFIN